MQTRLKTVVISSAIVSLMLIPRPAAASPVGEAVKNLEQAERDLDKAADTYKGHKAEARKEIHEAKVALDDFESGRKTNVDDALAAVDTAKKRLQWCKDKANRDNPDVEPKWIDDGIKKLDAAKEHLEKMKAR